MSSRKRQPLRFEELEPKGRGAILRNPDQVAAEQAELESRKSGSPETRQAGAPESRSVAPPQAATDRATYHKGTYRISPEAMEAMDEAKRVLRREYGVKVTFEEIAEQAILLALRDLLDNQESGFLVVQFSGSPEVR